MQQLNIDANTFTCDFGELTLFLSFAVNFNWSKITQELISSSKSTNHPEIKDKGLHIK